MTTVRDVITLGLQLARVVAIGKDPKAKESDTGLTILQGMYDSMFSDGQFSRLTDVYATEDYTAQENERIIADNCTITIPDVIEERTPRDLSAIIVITDTTQLNYVFSGGRWEACSALALDSDAPLATRGKDGLAALFAMHYAEAFGTSLGPLFTQRGRRFQGSLSYKLGSTHDSSTSVYY